MADREKISATYRVAWTIDVNAESPAVAARTARAIQRDRTRDAGVFVVTDEQDHATTVDLAEGGPPLAPHLRAVCPRCGASPEYAGFVQRDLIPGLAAFTPEVQADGSVFHNWIGETDVDWDGQRPEHDPPQIVCDACGHVFTTFALVPADAGA